MEQPVRPRVTLGAVLALVGATIAMPGAVAFPLTLLLIAARPATDWTRIGGIVTFLVTAGWMVYTGVEDPLNLLTHISTILGGLLFIRLMRTGPRPALESSLLATGVALAVGIAAISALGLDLGSSRADLVYSALPTDPETVAAFKARDLPTSALMAIFDATFALALIAGSCVAWHWYRIIAAPEGLPAPLTLSEFRFNDHLIWLFVLGLLGVVAQIGGKLSAGAGWPGVLLAVMTVLYAIRGFAVLWPRHPSPLLLLLVVAVLFLMQYALPGLLGLGLADTWLDFRRRAAAASGE